jgi:hypothetical protein
MGMFSEVNAENNAERLERVLRIALKYQSKDVFQFAKDNIVPLYEDDVGESWGSYKIPNDIKRGFNLK